jgi:hypothetical protein
VLRLLLLVVRQHPDTQDAMGQPPQPASQTFVPIRALLLLLIKII